MELFRLNFSSMSDITPILGKCPVLKILLTRKIYFLPIDDFFFVIELRKKLPDEVLIKKNPF